jgi:RNA polymerase sigma factor (sigma-70 family)
VTTVEVMAVSESGHLASEAVANLYRHHGTEVYRYAFAVLGNHADAEDVTQTTFLNAYRSLEQGVHPRKPANWLLTIASNAIKQRFRQEQARPRVVELDERTTGADTAEDEGPTVGELLAALSKIPPQQRQAIVLREFEGRSYAEIADILGVTTGALETLLFRARRSLAEELEHQLTCTEAQLAVSRAVDDRLGRKERRRLREHLAECPDCTRFARVQKRHRRALKGLMLVPVPLSLSFAKSLEGTAAAATLPAATVATTAGAGVGAASTAGGGALAGGVALKAAAIVTAATVTGGVAVTAASEDGARAGSTKPASLINRGERVGQVAPRGVLVPGNGVARGKAAAPGRTKSAEAKARAADRRSPTPAPGTRGSGSVPGAIGKDPQRAPGKATAPGRARAAGGPGLKGPGVERQADVAQKARASTRTRVEKAVPKGAKAKPARANSRNGGPRAP